MSTQTNPTILKREYLARVGITFVFLFVNYVFFTVIDKNLPDWVFLIILGVNTVINVLIIRKIKTRPQDDEQVTPEAQAKIRTKEFILILIANTGIVAVFSLISRIIQLIN